MPRPILATIHLNAIAHNLAQVRRHVQHTETDTVRIWAVVKANAYGHGIKNIYPALNEHADGMAMLDFAEAEQVRQLGWQKPILMLEGCFSLDDCRAAFKHKLSIVLHSHAQLTWLKDVQTTAPADQIIDVYLKINTGMNRLGFTSAQLPALQAALETTKGIGEVGVMTHFANADDALGVNWQLERFAEMRSGWLGRLNGPVSLANSAAILDHPQTAGDWVRPGIMLYGGSPFADKSAAQCGLRPVMTLTSQIIAEQILAPGERVGYGGIYTAQRPTRVGIVACGYADGYPRSAVCGTPILVCGQRTTTVGRVSMDMLACDLTDIPEARVGSPVVLWGEGLPADDVAAAAGTLAYELFCALAQRVPVLEV